MGAGGSGVLGGRVPLFVARVTDTDTDSVTLPRHFTEARNA